VCVCLCVGCVCVWCLCVCLCDCVWVCVCVCVFCVCGVCVFVLWCVCMCVFLWCVYVSLCFNMTKLLMSNKHTFFHWLNPSGRTMTLGPTKHLTEMRTNDSSCGLKLSVLWADNITTFICRLSGNSSKSLETLGIVRVVITVGLGYK